MIKFRSLLKRKAFWLLVAVVALGGFWWYTKSAGNVPPQYVLASVERGTLTTSVSGTGQVSASNQVDVKSQVSGMALRITVRGGQEVQSGTALAILDASDAEKAVRDAQLNLDSAKLSLQKLKQPVDTLSAIQANNALAQAEQSKQSATDDLAKAYDDGFNTVSNVFLDLPSIMTGLHDLLFSYNLSTSQSNIDFYAAAISLSPNQADHYQAVLYKDATNNGYLSAKTAYDTNFNDYKTTSRFTDRQTIEALVNETYETTKNISEAIKSANNLIQAYEDKLSERNQKINSLADTHLASLNSYTGKTNTDLSNLLAIKNTIQKDTDNIAAADRTVADKTESLAKLQAGPDPLDVQSQELSLRQRQAALDDARAKLADYVVRSPIPGIVAKIAIKTRDRVGSGTVVATIVTKQKLAEISLNEVDVAKIKAGQKAVLTFDAIDGLELTGVVNEIDTIGTVSQGVVSYGVKIVSDTQDDRVKSGMSVSAAIITNVAQDVLIVPNSAIKSQGNRQYVEKLDSPGRPVAAGEGVTSTSTPRQQMVTVGLANDTESEITSGLNEGDRIITRTITSAIKTSVPTTAAPSLFPTGGGRGGGGFRTGG